MEFKLYFNVEYSCTLNPYNYFSSKIIFFDFVLRVQSANKDKLNILKENNFNYLQKVFPESANNPNVYQLMTG